MRQLLFILVVGGLALPAQTITVVSAASYVGPVAPGSIASGFAPLLATSVTVTDRNGVARPASLFAAANGQVNFLVPAETATGTATVTARDAAGVTVTGRVEVATVAPALFTANNSGRGIPAALLLRVAGNGERTTAAVGPEAIDLAGETYLLLFGTGIRNTSRGVTATAAGETIPVLGAVAQGTFAGLDQVNIGPLPAALRGRDQIEIALTVDGQAANPVTVSVLSSSPGAWVRRPDLLEPISEMAVAELDGKVYVIGGYPSTRVSVRTVQVYDPIAGTWKLTTPLPVALNHTMSIAANGKIYVIGGQPDAGGNGPFVDTVYEYDPATAAWRARAPMPTVRGGGAAAVIDGKIYVAGGRPPRGSDFAVYDPVANRWNVLPDLPVQRNHIGAAAIGGKVYVVGGRFEAGFQSEKTDRMDVYDPVANRWAASTPLPRPRGGVNAIAALGCLHVLGGEGNDDVPTGVFPDHDVFHPGTGKWTSLGSMPIPVHGVTGAAFLNGLIHLPGGGTTIGGSSGTVFHQAYRPAISCQ